MNKQQALKNIQDALNINNWNYSVMQLSEKQTKYELSFTYSEYNCTLDTEILYIQGNICEMNMTLPVICPEEWYLLLYKYLMNRNLSKRYTSMQLGQKGKIICHYAFTLYDGAGPSEILKIYNMVKDAAMEDYSEIVNICKGKVQDQEKTKILGEIERLRTSLIHDNSSESAADKFKINI